MSEEAHSVRLDRVEGEVSGIRSEMGDIKTEMGRVQADVRGLGAILTRIEQGVLRSQEQQDQREASSRHSPVAVATVLVTIMSLLVGGAWMAGSNIARLDERSTWEQRQEDRLEQRVWIVDHRGEQPRGEPSQTGQ